MTKKVSTKTIENLTKGSQTISPKIIEFNKIIIEVKQYLPIQDKIMFVALVKENAFDEDIYNPIIQTLAFDVFIIKYYTNINLSDDLYEMYDRITSIGLIDEVKSNIPKSELDFLEKYTQQHIDLYNEKIDKDNTLINTIKKFLNNFGDKLPETLETLKTFDPKNYEMLNKVMEFNQSKE